LLQDGDQLQTGDDPRNQVILSYSHPGLRPMPLPLAQPEEPEESDQIESKSSALEPPFSS
jgi:hypothetical protein